MMVNIKNCNGDKGGRMFWEEFEFYNNVGDEDDGDDMD